MEKIKLKNITKTFGDREILHLKELVIQEKEKIGIVGRNGSGKSTLFNLIAGDIKPDTGTIEVKGSIGYIKQLDVVRENRMLSGGEQMKKIIQEKMEHNPNILLADEPSSNLDISSIEILKEKLIAYSGTLLLISHDRELLDAVCDSILEIENGNLKKYTGNYTTYKFQKEMEWKRKNAEYSQYQQEKAKLEKAIENAKGNAKNIKKAPKRMGNSESRLHKRESNQIKEKLEGHTKALQTRLEKLEEKEKPIDHYQIYMKTQRNTVLKNKYMVDCADISIRIKEKKLLEHTPFHVLTNRRTAVIGENGTGKTALLKKLIQGEIKINEQAKMAYFSQTFEILEEEKSILENVQKDSIQNETAIRNILGSLFIKGDEVYKKVKVLSGGERVKVSIAKILVSDANFILLDEPTNFLDITSIEALEKLLKAYQGTILFVTHDKKLIDEVATNLLLFKNQKLIEYEGNYSSYLAHENGKRSINSNEKLLRDMKLATLDSQIALCKNEKDREKLKEEYLKILKNDF